MPIAERGWSPQGVTFLIVWGGMIVWGSMTPHPPVPESALLGWDKLQHATAYGMLTILAARAWSPRGDSVVRRWLWASVGAIFFGGAMEIAQGVFTASRTAEVGDLVADAVGALLCATAGITIGRFRCGRGRNDGKSGT